MIGRLLWAVFCRVYGDGSAITAEMLDGIEAAIVEDMEMANADSGRVT
jgi:ribose 5-phosphate isomerase RpiB